ncbi:MAG: DUF4065 domain-containing protein [Polyangiales bacterium]
MHSSHALALADQLRARLDVRGGTDHLKLQKLCFYAYGAAIGLGVADGVGTVVFDAWKHGPVSRPIWDAFKAHKAAPLPPLDALPDPSWGTPDAHQVVDDVVEVYGRLSSWDIRCESHLEEPWVRAMHARSSLSNDEIREHFARKFANGRVMLPAYFRGAQSASVDGVPRARFESLHDMAQALRARA